MTVMLHQVRSIGCRCSVYRWIQAGGYIYRFRVVRCNRKSVAFFIVLEARLAFGIYTMKSRRITPLLNIGLLCLRKLSIEVPFLFKHCLGKQRHLWMFASLSGMSI